MNGDVAVVLCLGVAVVLLGALSWAWTSVTGQDREEDL